jgi:hypothetical protein
MYIFKHNISMPDDGTISPFNSARKCFLRQGVSLIGADSLGFESAVESITGIHAAFSRQFKEGQLNNWQPSSSWNQPGIVANNRYLTLAKDTMPHDIIPFSAIEDPKGILNKYVDDTYVHTSDNVVQYYERKLSEGKYRCVQIMQQKSIATPVDRIQIQVSNH